MSRSRSSSSSSATAGSTSHKEEQGDILTSCVKAAQRSMPSVGSGDGSQQLAIVKGGHLNILTTFFDTRKHVLKEYPPPPHAESTLAYLTANCPRPPLFGIDATKLDQYAKDLGRFDLIFFMFPHTGVFNNSSRNLSSNQYLLRGFLESSRALLKADGEVQITLKVSQHYDPWKLSSIVKEITGVAHRKTHSLSKRLFPGYVHRLTAGMSGHLKEVPDKKGGRVHVFRPLPPPTAESGGIKPETLPFDGKLLTVVSGPDTTKNVPTEEELEKTIGSCLVIEKSSSSPIILSALEIRRQAFVEPLPDVRQLNRVLYRMHRDKRLQKHPCRRPNKKRRWSLVVAP